MEPEMSKYDYASEKFSATVRTLAVADLPLRERLTKALENIKPLDADRHLPEDMHEDFQRLRRSQPDRMSPSQLYQLACDIVDISTNIDMLYYQSVLDKPNHRK
jgi:hypothetical protein